MTNETVADTKQIKALKACPMSQDEIENKYKGLAAKYPNAADLPYRTLSNTWRELGLSAKAIGRRTGALLTWTVRAIQ